MRRPLLQVQDMFECMFRHLSTWIFILIVFSGPSKKKVSKAWSKKRGGTAERATPIFYGGNNCFSRSLLWISPLLDIYELMYICWQHLGYLYLYGVLIWSFGKALFRISTLTAHCAFHRFPTAHVYSPIRWLAEDRDKAAAINIHCHLCSAFGRDKRPSLPLSFVFCSGLQYTLNHNRFIFNVICHVRFIFVITE